MKSHKALTALTVVSIVVMFASALFFLPEPVCTGVCYPRGGNLVVSRLSLPEPMCSGTCYPRGGNLVASTLSLPEPACAGACAHG